MYIPTLPFSRRLTATFLWILALTASAGGRAAVLTSSDGKSREFPVVVSAGQKGLTVRESISGKDIVIPWARLDAKKSAAANPWLEGAREKVQAGETVVLNLGVPATADPSPAPSGPQEEWRTVKATVAGGGGKNFESLSLSAYVHRDVPVPRLAVIWIGGTSPLAKRADAADLARRMHGALVVADFRGGYVNADGGSGAALVSGVTDLLRQARSGAGSAGGKEGGAQPDSAGGLGKGGSKEMKEKPGEEGAEAGENGEAPAPRARPALVVIGDGEAAGFVWSLVCTRPGDVMAAITLNGVHAAESTAGAFATPCLFLESPAPSAEASPATAEDLKRPRALWRHYSTDGCRWCYAASAGDPLTLAVAFAREVAAASPYVEALEMLESWEQNKLRHRIPMPVATAKSFKENAFRLATPDGGSVYSVKSKVGAARNDLVWVPSASFAARLAGK